MVLQIDKDVQMVLDILHKNGHEAYIVGGCVRDMILGHVPHDFDITTSAEPMEVKSIFKKTIDTGLQHGTVTVMVNGEGYEVTTYRIDGAYLDNRHPESVIFTKSLTEDLKRRDFTINAMAYSDEEGVVDLFGGRQDMEAGIIRCVGRPQERFKEDALRMLRAIRFAARFGFDIEQKTEEAIRELSSLIKNISDERIHMELTKTLCSPNPKYIERLVTYGLIEHIIPEFIPNVGLNQANPYHIYDVDRHIYETLSYIEADEGLRWTMYLHDIGKAYTKTTDAAGIDHFYGHQKVSEELSNKILKRLKFDNKTREKITKLIYFHDDRFKSDMKSVRKAVARMGEDCFEDYLKVRYADLHGQCREVIASGVQSIEDKRMLFHRVLEEKQCTTIKELAINGGDLIDLGMTRGKGIGIVLSTLLEMVVEDPSLNERESLLALSKVLIEKEGAFIDE